MKLPVASYSFLNTWAICPHQAARKYIVKDLPREPETPEMAWGNAVHEAMEKRLRDKTPLPQSMASYEYWAAPLDALKIEPEQKLGMTVEGQPCDFFAKNVFLRGKLDAPVRLRRDYVMIFDWKTGKRREEPFELAVGALLLQAHWPEVVQLLGQYIWLKYSVNGKQHDVSDTARTWAVVKDTMREVECAIVDNEFRKTPGPLCGWCPVLDCQHNTRGRK